MTTQEKAQRIKPFVDAIADGKVVDFEDDAGYLHTMILESKNEDNRTVTGWTTVFRDGERQSVKVTVPDHRLRP